MRRIGVAVLTGWVLIMSGMAHAADGLAGTAWRIEAVKDAAVADPGRTELKVDDQGRMASTVGCNRMSGSAKVDGAKVSFGAIASTRMACEPALMELERKYGAALSSARTYRIDGEILMLLDEKGDVLVTLSRAR